MHPNELIKWVEEQSNKRRSLAMKYIEENVDLIDVDLQQFMDNCPSTCQLEVAEMLLKAGIDLKDYVCKDSLKKWETYMRDSTVYNPYMPHQYYTTIDYKQEIDECIKEAINWKTDWLVLDTIPAMKEA